jgi:hypothetical protein
LVDFVCGIENEEKINDQMAILASGHDLDKGEKAVWSDVRVIGIVGRTT